MNEPRIDSLFLAGFKDDAVQLCDLRKSECLPECERLLLSWQPLQAPSRD